MDTYYYWSHTEILPARVPCVLRPDGGGGQSLIVGSQLVLTLLSNGTVCRHTIVCQDGLHVDTDGRVKMCNG